jgi:hypothetical protein
MSRSLYPTAGNAARIKITSNNSVTERTEAGRCKEYKNVGLGGGPFMLTAVTRHAVK